MSYRTIVAIALLALLAATACAIAADDRPGGDGRDTDALSEKESRELLSMREEEKLARDVYAALGDQWGRRIFSNIGSAEQRHMNALASAIERYGLDDPVKDEKRGAFTDAKFAKLYKELVETGSESRLEALKVGALIEEMDIGDLREALDATTHDDLKRVYENLMRASRNHLRAFAGQIEALGGSYEAKHLSQKEFDKIAASPWEPGHGRGAGKGHGAGGGRGKRHRGGRG
jgi:hypothetical protein